MTDRVQRRTRGLLAIAISDAIEAAGIQPISPVLVGLRSFSGKAGDIIASQPGYAKRSTVGIVGCVGLFGILVLPLLLPIEIVRGARVRRHNEAMMRRLSEAGAPPPDGTAGSGALRAALPGADSLLAIDWTIWRDGTVCFAGTALGVVRGDEHLAHWFTVHRGPPPPGALAATGLKSILAELPVVTTRWEWELHDPFEAVERNDA
jgi:hypothetical protein